MVATPAKPLPSWLEGKKLNKIEQNKANKDGLLVGSEIEEFARVGWAVSYTHLRAHET